jgi:hypothetical protein
VTLPFICKLNEFVARNEALEWGVLRTGSVGISGTDYVPPIPVEEEVQSELDALLFSGSSVTQTAIDVFLWARGVSFSGTAISAPPCCWRTSCWSQWARAC